MAYYDPREFISDYPKLASIIKDDVAFTPELADDLANEIDKMRTAMHRGKCGHVFYLADPQAFVIFNPME